MSKTVNTIDKVFIEDPRRALVIGGALVVIVVLLIVFWSRIKSFVARIRNSLANDSVLNEWQTSTGQYPTLSESEYVVLCSKLEAAAKGPGTDENAIYNVFNKMNNTADVLKLVSVYGTRDGQTLPEMIRAELSDSWPFNEIKKLNKILSDKGIAYTF